MILAFDIGNTSVSAGVYDGASLVAHWKTRRPRRSEPRWWRELAILACLEAGVAPRGLRGTVVCSVVPAATRSIVPALRRLTGAAPFVVRGGPGLGIRFAYDDPGALGPDRVCAMIAAVRRYGSPVIVVDCGTAITIDGVARGGRHVGGMIAPGLAAAAAALGRTTAQLPAAAWGVPAAAAGRDTLSGIRSGIWHMTAGGIREAVRRLRPLAGRRARVVGTGGDAAALMDGARVFDVVDPHLVLDGAAMAWRKAGGQAAPDRGGRRRKDASRKSAKGGQAGSRAARRTGGPTRRRRAGKR